MRALWRARLGAARVLVRALAVAHGQGEAQLVGLEGQEQQGAPAIAPVADGTGRCWLLARGSRPRAHDRSMLLLT